MTLMKEVAADVASLSSQLAFLLPTTSVRRVSLSRPPPMMWPPMEPIRIAGAALVLRNGPFPNYRNVLWLHNWAPVTRFQYSRYGVETFGVPVPWSVSYVGDDVGEISEMTTDKGRSRTCSNDGSRKEWRSVGLKKERGIPSIRGKMSRGGPVIDGSEVFRRATVFPLETSAREHNQDSDRR